MIAWLKGTLISCAVVAVIFVVISLFQGYHLGSPPFWMAGCVQEAKIDFIIPMWKEAPCR